MGSSSKPAPKAPKSDPQKDISTYLKQFNKALPKIYKAEARFRPQLVNNDLSEMRQYLSSSNGLLSQTDKALGESQSQINAAVKGDLASQEGQVGQVRGFLAALDPDGAENVNQISRISDQAFSEAQNLTGEQSRNAIQAAREGSLGRGRINDNNSISAEAASVENAVQNNRNLASAYGQQALNQSQRFYTTPGMAILQGTPESLLRTDESVSRAGILSGDPRPKLYNFGQAIGIGDANRQNDFNYKSSVYSANQQNAAANQQAIIAGAGAAANAAILI